MTDAATSTSGETPQALKASGGDDNICIECNICCDGTLFSRVGVSPEEQEKLKEKGRFYTKSNGELRMWLGCMYLGKDGCCECYDDRPEICRSYRCDLLKAVQAGHTTSEEARSIIREAKDLRAKAVDACRSALSAGGGEVKAAPDIDAWVEKLEDSLSIATPIPSKAVTLAKYRYRCFVEWIRLHIKHNHLRPQ